MALTDEQKKAYQTVIAGRTREDELLGFFGKNFIAVPGRTFASKSVGGDIFPSTSKNAGAFVSQRDHLNHESVGKADDRDSVIHTHLPTPYQTRTGDSDVGAALS